MGSSAPPPCLTSGAVEGEDLCWSSSPNGVRMGYMLTFVDSSGPNSPSKVDSPLLRRSPSRTPIRRADAACRGPQASVNIQRFSGFLRTCSWTILWMNTQSPSL